MNCTEFEDRLHEQFGRVPPGAGDAPALAEADGVELVFAEHSRECPQCRALCDRLHLLADGIFLWREQVPDVDLVAAVVAAYEAQPASTVVARPNDSRDRGPRHRSPHAQSADGQGRAGLSGHRSARRAMWLTLASLVALVAVLVVLPGPKERPPVVVGDRGAGAVDRRAATASGDRSIAQSPVDAFSGDRPPVAEIPDAVAAAYYDNLAQKAAGALGEVTAFVLPGTAAKSSPSTPPRDVSPGWIDGLQHQLSPIGRSLDSAFDFLWQAGQSADNSRT